MMNSNLKKIASKLFLKWADEVPVTLRSGQIPESVDPGLANTQRPSPVTVDTDVDVGAPSILDVNRHLRPFNKEKEHLYIILNLMFKSGLITSHYYKSSIDSLDEATGDTTNIFLDFVDIVHRAELEAQTYMKNLQTLKKLIRK